MIYQLEMVRKNDTKTKRKVDIFKLKSDISDSLKRYVKNLLAVHQHEVEYNVSLNSKKATLKGSFFLK